MLCFVELYFVGILCSGTLFRTGLQLRLHNFKGPAMPMGVTKKTIKDKTLKKTSVKTKPPRMSLDEQRLVREMAFDRRMIPEEIARALGRHPSSVCRLLAKKKPSTMGRPPLLTDKMKDHLENIAVDMVAKADADYEVTLPMILRRSRLKCSERTAARALHERGYRFFRLYEKMILTPEDIKERLAWSKKHAMKSRLWWLRKVHVHFDNHHFKRPSTAKGRKLLAKRSVRGAYRKKGTKADSIKSCFVKPSPKLRTSVGTKGVLKMGGVGGGQVLVWETIEGTWSGDMAADMYKNVVKLALEERYPGTSKFTTLEDNDPIGNMSKKGKAAKAVSKLGVLTIPKRSPDLNVLDFSIWSTVERLLRKQERSMKHDKHETREAFIKRLDRTAKNLPTITVEEAIGDLRKRCQLLLKAKGGLFVEGGRKVRPL